MFNECSFKESFLDIDIDTFSPDHNSTAVLVGDKLYAGTAADYQVPIHCDHCHPAAYAGLPDPGDRDGKLIFNLGSIDNFLDIYIIFLQL